MLIRVGILSELYLLQFGTIKTSALGVCDSIFIRNYRLAPRSQDVKSFDKTVQKNSEILRGATASSPRI